MFWNLLLKQWILFFDSPNLEIIPFNLAWPGVSRRMGDGTLFDGPVDHQNWSFIPSINSGWGVITQMWSNLGWCCLKEKWFLSFFFHDFIMYSCLLNQKLCAATSRIFLLFCVCVCVCVLVAQLCPTPCNSMDCIINTCQRRISH